MASWRDARATQRKESGFKEMTRPGRRSGYFACDVTAIGLLGRLVEALNAPAALQSALIDKNPMTCQRRPGRQTPARGAATTGRIVIGMHGLKPMRCHTPWLNKPEFCEFFEHRSPPRPLCAAGQ